MCFSLLAGNPIQTGWNGNTIKTDINGYIPVDRFIRNLKVYAIGDVNGVQMFRHAANEAEIAWHNAPSQTTSRRKSCMITAPCLGLSLRVRKVAVGMTRLKPKSYIRQSQKVFYYETAKGEAMQKARVC